MTNITDLNEIRSTLNPIVMSDVLTRWDSPIKGDEKRWELLRHYWDTIRENREYFFSVGQRAIPAFAKAREEYSGFAEANREIEELFEVLYLVGVRFPEFREETMAFRKELLKRLIIDLRGYEFRLGMAGEIIHGNWAEADDMRQILPEIVGNAIAFDDRHPDKPNTIKEGQTLYGYNPGRDWGLCYVREGRENATLLVMDNGYGYGRYVFFHQAGEYKVVSDLNLHAETVTVEN